MPDDELIPTRASLLERLKDLGDQASWNEFYQTYRELIYSVARKARLNETEAHEVVQETLIAAARKMPEFKYDPATDSFKGWLLQLTRWRILDQLRRRQPVKAGQPCNPSSAGGPDVRTEAGRMGVLPSPLHAARDDTSTTPAVERIADPAGFDLAAIWDEEWEKHLLDAALARIKRTVHPQHYEIYHLHVLLGQPAREVAQTLGVNVAQIYLAKHRVARLLRKEIKRLQMSWQ